MSNLISAISGYMAYPFVRYALIVGVLIALCSSLLGVILVLKRYSFIGDGLSHVAFGALSIATVLRINNEMIVVLPITVICANHSAVCKIFGENKGRFCSRNDFCRYTCSRLSSDEYFSHIIKYKRGCLRNAFRIDTDSNPSLSDVWLCIGLSAAVIAVFVLFIIKYLP